MVYAILLLKSSKSSKGQNEAQNDSAPISHLVVAPFYRFTVTLCNAINEVGGKRVNGFIICTISDGAGKKCSDPSNHGLSIFEYVFTSSTSTCSNRGGCSSP